MIFNSFQTEFEREQLSAPEALVPEVNSKDLKSPCLWEFSHCHRALKKKFILECHEKLLETMWYIKSK